MNDQIKLKRIAQGCREVLAERQEMIAEYKRLRKKHAEQLKNKSITISRLKALAVAKVTGWRPHSQYNGFIPQSGGLHPYKHQSELISEYPTKARLKKLNEMLLIAEHRLAQL